MTDTGHWHCSRAQASRQETGALSAAGIARSSMASISTGPQLDGVVGTVPRVPAVPFVPSVPVIPLSDGVSRRDSAQGLSRGTAPGASGRERGRRSRRVALQPPVHSRL